MPTHERERTQPVSLCTAAGTLSAEAVGWSRHPLQDCALPGPWGRRKRWDYWCITAEPWVIQLTVLNADFMRLGTAAVFEVTGGDVLESTVVRGPGALQQPDTVEGGDTVFEAGGLSARVTPGADGTRLQVWFKARGKSVEVDAMVEPATDTLNVVVPWSSTRYQFTSKHVGRPCRGTLRIEGVERALEGEAGFDYGRGRWPSATRWNWGAGAGMVGAHQVGLQVGGQWTDGTGMTENGVFVDGVLDKLGDRLVFEPSQEWRVYSPDSDVIDLRFIPSRDRSLWIPGVVTLNLVFGHWHGVVRAHDKTLQIENMFGWTEEMRVRW
ncbi:MAG: DUF2804 domain-containing protein [Proteobacteria bacterium]|nr:DUF2804 domain-containing protein [Pseudomonadota bacterium]